MPEQVRMLTDLPQRSGTAERILDVAERLIQSRGYSAISYQDVADALSIRKPSVHYHFASKADLGVAVIDRYAHRFSDALSKLADDQSHSSMHVLECYFERYVSFAGSQDQVCLCGALAGEFSALPPDMQTRVSAFFEFHQDWLRKILKRGVDRGEFSLDATPEKVARVVFGAMQGALLVSRVVDDPRQVHDVRSVLKAQLSA